MTSSTISSEFKKILDVFNQLLPEGDELEQDYRIADSARGDNEDKRIQLWEKYNPIVTKALSEKDANLLVDFLVNPIEHVVEGRSDDRDFRVNLIASVYAGLHFEHNATEESARKVLKRFCYILNEGENLNENPSVNSWERKEYPNRVYFPNASTCLSLLSKNCHFDFVLSELKSIFTGKFNKLLDHGEDEYNRFENTSVSLLGYDSDSFKRFLFPLYQAGELDYEWFKASSLLFPGKVQKWWVDMDEEAHLYKKENSKYNFPEGMLEVYSQYYYKLLKEVLPELRTPEKPIDAFEYFYRADLAGISWMREGLDLLIGTGRKAKNLKNTDESIDYCIRYMLEFHHYGKDETEADLIALLKGYDEKTLLVAYPYVGKARQIILKALGWEDILPVHQAIFQIGGECPDGLGVPCDLYNSESTTQGVIERTRFIEMLGAPNPKRVTKLFKAIRASSMDVTNILTLINALLNIEREKIITSLARLGQIAIKAYGLLPLHDANEVKGRYLKFKQMSKDASLYGQERSANTRAAVICGLKNLAQTAGYTDEVRMGWTMEADITSNLTPFDVKYDALDWQISLHLEGVTPKIRIFKKDKKLKSVPPKVRKTDIYQEMRESQEQIKRQASSFRQTLEAMMCDGDSIEFDKLGTLSKLPVVNSMLEQLILKVGENKFGMFTGSTRYVKGMSDETLLIQEPPTIAHVYDLFNSKVLSEWQRTIVERKIVQPFKQAFRELYIVTPAEIESGMISRRFIGHVIDGATASRLLQSRKWSQSNGDVVDVFKMYPKHKTVGSIEVPDSRHYLAESDSLTLDEIWFTINGKKTEISNVDPLVFSEFMRDVDLIVSVAQVDDQDIKWSKETTQRRAELVTNLIQSIDLKQVYCEDHYAFIQGKLAKYRIHLGSGVIHIQPGNYLCIVPSRDKSDDLYLPFAEADMKMAEIVSKIFLLIGDDKIDDKSILSQIKPSLKDKETESV